MVNMKNNTSVTWHSRILHLKKNCCQTTPLEMQCFYPTAALLPASESCFSFRPLKSERRGPYRSQSEAGRPQRCSSQPLGLYEGGLWRPQPVLLPLFTKRLGAGWTTPLSTPQYNGKQGSGKILETCTHTCHSLDLGGSNSYYLRDTRSRRRGQWGELVSICGWCLKGYKGGGMMKSLWAEDFTYPPKQVVVSTSG